MSKNKIWINPCPECDGRGKNHEYISIPMPSGLSMEEIQDWPCAEKIWIVCRTCNGKKYIDKDEASSKSHKSQ